MSINLADVIITHFLGKGLDKAVQFFQSEGLTESVSDEDAMEVIDKISNMPNIDPRIKSYLEAVKSWQQIKDEIYDRYYDGFGHARFPMDASDNQQLAQDVEAHDKRVPKLDQYLK